MIISKTPFRLSFLGGGTDLPSFFEQEEGAVISVTLDKYMYLALNKRFDETFRLSYSQTEICKSVDEIHHPIFRKVLKRYARPGEGLELVSIADIPAGSGLGSSSSFTVGLLNVLKNHLGKKPTAQELAQEASQIEIEELGEPIGKQDQFAAAFGGMNFIRFKPDGSVIVEPVELNDQKWTDLQKHILVFFTGKTRSASQILQEQKQNTNGKLQMLREMKRLAVEFRKCLETNFDLQSCGDLLQEGWQRKKSMAQSVSNLDIDGWYERGLKAGAWGGKILGAGGGGFLMFLCPPGAQERVKNELKDLRPIPMGFDRGGSQIYEVPC